MFTVLGIISLIAGVFVFIQASALVSLESLAGAFGSSTSNMGGMFSVVAILLIVGGALSIACKSGEKRGFVKACCWLWGIASLAGFANFSVGDMAIWAVVCGVLCTVYIFWLKRNPV